MPFNQLILPLLGGYLLITYAHCFVYWSSRQSKEQLLFASAFAGALLAISARVFTLAVASTDWGHWLYEFLHRFVNYEGIGTAVLSLAFGVVLVVWINRAWPKAEAGLWLYGRGSLTHLEALLYASFTGSVPSEDAIFRSLPVELPLRLFASVPLIGLPVKRKIQARKSWRIFTIYDETNNLAVPAPLMVTMKDRKVYVGFLQHSPSLQQSSMSHLSFEVVSSGYRDKDDLRVQFTDDYTEIFSSENPVTTLPSYKVFPVADIVSANFFDAGVFDKFQRQKIWLGD
ncbi:hypothetical protein [Xanthomonas arboricola]|uniref:hypothetical protein n=1 Tax=Xanthomonas arboricola TaxID=56448 RepID=UPI000A921290|nr:hypothetical protein [Xanthomonas arboricola]MBB3850301.1 hypothetical protein [Xanthomonas arboricola]CAD7386079.1 hypothetical protein X12_003820 [Xanthomonas arboricola]CAG2096753.1 hypothetical protein XCY_003823 [Xanthomonas arboricola pv. juglandis]